MVKLAQKKRKKALRAKAKLKLIGKMSNKIRRA